MQEDPVWVENEKKSHMLEKISDERSKKTGKKFSPFLHGFHQPAAGERAGGRPERERPVRAQLPAREQPRPWRNFLGRSVASTKAGWAGARSRAGEPGGSAWGGRRKHPAQDRKQVEKLDVCNS
ncbi:unnamed protein product [Caretta caretta]